jgi:hypothetical protein
VRACDSTRVALFAGWQVAQRPDLDFDILLTQRHSNRDSVMSIPHRIVAADLDQGEGRQRPSPLPDDCDAAPAGAGVYLEGVEVAVKVVNPVFAAANLVPWIPGALEAQVHVMSGAPPGLV